MYEELLKLGKNFPEVESEYDRVIARVYSKINDIEMMQLIPFVLEHYQNLTQKEIITLSLVAQHEKIFATDLRSSLQLSEEDKIKYWIGSLVEKKLVLTRGEKKGTSYIINDALLQNAKIQRKPNLKTIETNVLKELIKSSMVTGKEYSMNELYSLFVEYDTIEKEFKRIVRKMANDGELGKLYGKTHRKYCLKIKEMKKE